MIPSIVFSDFDGTLTHHTDFTTDFFSILEILEKNSIPLVIVTGRSISWGHFLLTHFSNLNHVICEGGGVIVGRKKGNHLYNDYLVEEKDRTRLRTFSKALLKKFHGLELTIDSIGRRTDRAIELDDLTEDLERMKEIKAFMEKEKINYSQSNVHLNFWCGEVSKYKAVVEFMKRNYSSISLDQTVFFGDSLNDESMFKNLSNTVGVSNIKSVLKKLEYEPSEILVGEENEGPKGVYNYLKSSLK